MKLSMRLCVSNFKGVNAHGTYLYQVAFKKVKDKGKDSGQMHYNKMYERETKPAV